VAAGLTASVVTLVFDCGLLRRVRRRVRERRFLVVRAWSVSLLITRAVVKREAASMTGAANSRARQTSSMPLMSPLVLLVNTAASS
jgi:hypothetical protein